MEETEEIEDVVNEQNDSPNAWLIKTELAGTSDWFSIELPHPGSIFQGISADREDILILLDENLAVFGYGRVYRKRAGVKNTQFYFDRVERLEAPKLSTEAGFQEIEQKGIATRVAWPDFQNAYKVTTEKDYTGLPMLDENSSESKVYVRELIKLTTIDNLLGPADGPNEEIVGAQVSERYLVGKLAPRTNEETEENIEGLQGVTAPENQELLEEEDELRPLDNGTRGGSRFLPGQEFSTASDESHEPDDDDSSQIDASKNQSFVPSSVGMTICVDATVEEIEIEANWGSYRKQESDLITKDDGSPIRVWKRISAGGNNKTTLKTGWMKPHAPDPNFPNVILQGVIREAVDGNYRMVSIFLVNNQILPEENQDAAWVFQPEIIVRDPAGEAIFCKRPVVTDKSIDEVERATLDMIYRNKVEFAVGHTISVHATCSKKDPEKAIEIRTQVIPEYEVPATETPGLNPTDRPEMQRMVSEGLLDMRKLAGFKSEELGDALSVLTNDYLSWISEQTQRIGNDVVGHDSAAHKTMDRCQNVYQRLIEGIEILKTDPIALKAFQFANLSMADQRVHGMLAMETRRGTGKTLEELNEPQNHSWRPFQLAFILLSIPSLANPKHKDRTKPLDAYADLLWFPTGGGKTEAYLGVAAFTMGIRRLQGNLGGYDASRGLSVIMRYTLRLLTLQQFQRATTLICAMEMIRRNDQSTGVKSHLQLDYG